MCIRDRYSIAEVSMVIMIEVPDEDIVERIVGRRMDPETGDIYHTKFRPAPSEILPGLSRERMTMRKL